MFIDSVRIKMIVSYICRMKDMNIQVLVADTGSGSAVYFGGGTSGMSTEFNAVWSGLILVWDG